MPRSPESRVQINNTVCESSTIHQIFQMEEPDDEEIGRIRIEELIRGDEYDDSALQFAYSSSVFEGNTPDQRLIASSYLPVYRIEEKDEHGRVYFIRYTNRPDDPNLGLILTNISRSRVQTYSDGEPIIYQMGPKRRMLALAQRIEFFRQHQHPFIHETIYRLERGEHSIPHRPNRRHQAIEDSLGVRRSLLNLAVLSMGKFIPHDIRAQALAMWQATRTISWDEIGYKKRSSEQIVSRRPDVSDYLLTKIGKYYRRPIGGGSMPVTTGSKDALAMFALGHMVSFIPRNSRYAGNIELQIALAKSARSVIEALSIPEDWKHRAYRNIGVSLGIDNPEAIIKEAVRLYQEAGITLFRIYTIGSDPRVVETARLLRKTLGDEIEIFVGQIPDKAMAKKLMHPDIRVDALIYGHGGGRQCTSGENHMAITTVEEVYEAVTDASYNNTTILVEGGVGTNIASVLILGADGVLYNNRVIHGAIESPAGDLYFMNEQGKYVQPYPGSASAETAIIESMDPQIRRKRTTASGRIYTEGKPGFMHNERKTGGSMAFHINELLGYISKMFADLGVKNIAELRMLLADERQEVLRIVSGGAQYIATAYGNT